MSIEIKILRADDEAILDRVAGDVFDNAVNPGFAREFLSDSRHHLAVAIDEGQVVGMISAVHYVHPDKAPELWINEVAVAGTHHRRGIGRSLIAAILERGRALGCMHAWVLTDRDNRPAMQLYAGAGGKERPRVPVMFEFDLR